MNNLIDVFKPVDNYFLELKIFLNDLFIFTQLASPTFTVLNLKEILLFKLELESINYKLFYNKHDITNMEFSTFNEIILLKNKPSYPIIIQMNSTILEPPNQKVLLAIIEGESNVVLYKTKSKRFVKIIPNFSYLLKFYPKNLFPYNCRTCHIVYPYENKLVITGGLGYSKMACYYDYSINSVEELPDMEYDRERHSMICIGQYRVFIIGGVNSRKVTLLQFRSQQYQEYPDLNCERSESSLCFVNERFLYVFMGIIYDNEIIQPNKPRKDKGYTNYEVMELKENLFECKWEKINIGYDLINNMPKSISGVIYREDEDGKYFLFFGGAKNGKFDNGIIKLERNRCEFKNYFKLSMRFIAGFSESAFFKIEEEYEEGAKHIKNFLDDYYLMSYAKNTVVHVNFKKEIVEEIKNTKNK